MQFYALKKNFFPIYTFKASVHAVCTRTYVQYFVQCALYKETHKIKLLEKKYIYNMYTVCTVLQNCWYIRQRQGHVESCHI